MKPTVLVTVSGRHVDLLDPQPGDIDLDDIAEQVAKEARFNGATPGVIYYVAQHLSLGADWIICEATGHHEQIGEELAPLRFDASEEVLLTAAYYLLHDAPEAYLKDDTTPKKRALDAIAKSFGNAYGVISESEAKLTERFDAAIHARAGLAWPMPPEILARVKDIDARMLVTEWKQLRKAHPLPDHYAHHEPLPIKVEPWSWQFAQAQLAERMAVLLPALRKGV